VTDHFFVKVSYIKTPTGMKSMKFEFIVYYSSIIQHYKVENTDWHIYLHSLYFFLYNFSFTVVTPIFNYIKKFLSPIMSV
jgi:hypothetical protein